MIDALVSKNDLFCVMYKQPPCNVTDMSSIAYDDYLCVV